MRFHRNCVLVLLVSLLGCTASHVANTPAPPPTPVPTAVRRAYNGTAAVGDFLTISINSTLSTLTYTNLTNGESGTIPYTTQADGSYAMKDPSGNLIAAYEVPNYALVVESMKSGPGRDTPALITAVESGPISMATFENNDYNYMQFRTAFGGLSVGSADVSSTAVETSEYWPYGAITNDGDQPFHESSMALSLFTEDKSGTFLTGTLPDGGGSATLFGTANGFFVVDTGNGSILGLEKGLERGLQRPRCRRLLNALLQEDKRAGEPGRRGDRYGCVWHCEDHHYLRRRTYNDRSGRRHDDDWNADSGGRCELPIWQHGRACGPVLGHVHLPGDKAHHAVRHIRVVCGWRGSDFVVQGAVAVGRKPQLV